MLAQPVPAEPKGGFSLPGQAGTQEVSVAAAPGADSQLGRFAGGGCRRSCPQLSALPLFAADTASASCHGCLIARDYNPLYQEACVLNSSLGDAEEGSLKYFSSCFPRS